MLLPRTPAFWKRRAVIAVVIAAFAAGVSTGVADEGMWLPFMLDKSPVDSWHARGLELSTDEIYHPRDPSISDAIVQVGGGTGSFVSFDGLILTNHHVAFGALQRTSSVKTSPSRTGSSSAPSRRSALARDSGACAK